jgi:hypothetical protein
MTGDVIGGCAAIAYAGYWAWVIWTALTENEVSFRGATYKRGSFMYWAVIGVGGFVIVCALFVATIAFLDARKLGPA